MLRQGWLLIAVMVCLGNRAHGDIRVGMDLSSTGQYTPEGASLLVAARPSARINYQRQTTQLQAESNVELNSNNFQAIDAPTWQFKGTLQQQLIAPLLSFDAGYDHSDELSLFGRTDQVQENYHLGLNFHKKTNLLNSFSLSTRYQWGESQTENGRVESESVVASLQYRRQLNKLNQLLFVLQHQDYLNGVTSSSTNISYVKPLAKGILTSLLGYTQSHSNDDDSDVLLASINLSQNIPDRATLNYALTRQRIDSRALLNDVPGFETPSINQLFDTTTASVSVQFPSLNTRLQTQLAYQYNWLEQVFEITNPSAPLSTAQQQEYDLATAAVLYQLSEDTQLELTLNYQFSTDTSNSELQLAYERFLAKKLKLTAGAIFQDEETPLERLYLTLNYRLGWQGQ